MPPLLHPLPNFDQLALDRRFLAELDRLRKTGAFASYRELADILDVRTNLVNEIATGRAHCNLKLLYTLAQYYPMADVQGILFGSAPAAGPGAP